MKTLPQFIAEIGDEPAAALFDVKVRTVAGWRRGERMPRPLRARKIIAATARHPSGPVDWEGIFRGE